jgi:hypothetical protein
MWQPRICLAAMASTVLAHAAQRSSTALATADDCLAHRPGCSCVDTSMRALRFAATDLEYHAFYAAASPARKTSWAFVGFNLSNSAVGYQTACAAFSNRQDGPGGAEDGDVGGFFYGDVWFWCESTGSGGNDTAAAARFAYNRTSGELEISQRWTCRDDPMFPYVPPLCSLE